MRALKVGLDPADAVQVEPSPSRAPVPDAGDIVLGWLTKVVVVLAVVGVAAFDAISIGSSRVAVEDAAAAAARVASDRAAESGDVQTAYLEAVATATETNPLNEVPADSFVVAPDATVSLVVQREATTFVVHRIGWIQDWALVRGHATAEAIR